MKIIKAIIIGGFIWILASSFYSASYFLSFMEDIELQANLVLAITIIPSSCLGAHLYYKWVPNMPILKLGSIMLLTAISLDALVTVPFLIIPQGGSYQEFFSAIAFWLIAAEYLIAIFTYWYFKVKPQLNQAQ
jgi:hypothetical protein